MLHLANPKQYEIFEKEKALEYIKLEVIDNPGLKKLAYQLRYDVFTLEQGDQRYANHNDKTYMDIWDTLPSNLIIAYINNYHIIGTLRLIERKYGPYLGEEGYQYDLLSKNLDVSKEFLLDKISILTRGVVAKDYRSLGVFSMMCDYANTLAVSMDSCISIAAIATDNSASKKFFGRLGYKFYATGVNKNKWKGDYCYKLLNTD